MPHNDSAQKTDTVADRVADVVLDAPARLGAIRLVAVDGPSGGGKTTFARSLTERLAARGVDVLLIGTDEFATWADPVAWWPRLADGVLEPFAAGVPGNYRRTAWVDGVPEPGENVLVTPPAVLVLEGVSAGRASIRPRLSHLCWVATADPDERLARAIRRDGDAARDPLRKWQEFEKGWFAVDRTELFAGTSLGVRALGC